MTGTADRLAAAIDIARRFARHVDLDPGLRLETARDLPEPSLVVAPMDVRRKADVWKRCRLADYLPL